MPIRGSPNGVRHPRPQEAEGAFGFPRNRSRLSSARRLFN
jgi:hypothetical protein